MTAMNKKVEGMSINNDRLYYNYCKPFVPDTHFEFQNLWLLKPIDLNRGRGIHVFNSLDRLFELVKEMTV